MGKYDRTPQDIDADPKLPVRVKLAGSYSEATALRLIAALKEQ